MDREYRSCFFSFFFYPSTKDTFVPFGSREHQTPFRCCSSAPASLQQVPRDALVVAVDVLCVPVCASPRWLSSAFHPVHEFCSYTESASWEGCRVKYENSLTMRAAMLIAYIPRNTISVSSNARKVFRRLCEIRGVRGEQW